MKLQYVQPYKHYITISAPRNYKRSSTQLNQIRNTIYNIRVIAIGTNVILT